MQFVKVLAEKLNANLASFSVGSGVPHGRGVVSVLWRETQHADNFSKLPGKQKRLLGNKEITLGVRGGERNREREAAAAAFHFFLGPNREIIKQVCFK